jgi:restriction system protein
MAKPRNKRPQRALNTLQEKGYGACGLGVAMLIAPKLLGGSPGTAAVAQGLQTPGWLVLGAGLVLLTIHHVTHKNSGTTSLAPPFVDSAPSKPIIRHRPPPGGSAPVREHRWSAAVFAAIEWRRFEAVCERLFAQGGFHTRAQSHGADGGVDIWLHSRHAEGPVAVVQCKHWQNKAIGVKELREFFGVMASHQLLRGTYATSSTYTADARQFAKDNGINALDGTALLSLIATRTPGQQQELLDVAYEGEYWRPTCASCGIKLVERTPSNSGAKFWGCSNYPRCKSRIAMAAQKV